MAIITVTSNSDQGAGSLRDAISMAGNGDTIQFAEALSKMTIKLKSGQLMLDKSITIDGQNAPGLTVSGNQIDRVFQIEKNIDVTFKSLIIADGKIEGEGGGILARQGSSLTLIDTKLENNQSELGGAIRLGHLAEATITNSEFNGNDGTLTTDNIGFSAGAISTDSKAKLSIKGTTFKDNRGFNGGAIYVYSSAKFEVEDSDFVNNIAQNRAGGGAIFTDGINPSVKDLSTAGTLLIHNSRFEGNQTDGGGGALFLFGYGKDKTVIKDSVFIGNKANPKANGIARGGAIQSNMELIIQNSSFIDNISSKQGGALWLDSKRPVNIINSTFSGNEAVGDAGGAMFLNIKSVPVNITSSTIVNNSAGRANGALWYSKDHSVTLTNSIVAFNTAKQDLRQSQVGFQAFDGGGNLEFSPERRSMRVFANSIVADPKLTPLKKISGTLAYGLEADSPAINTGRQSVSPSLDQRGRQRDSLPDIGAFEYTTASDDTSMSSTKENKLALDFNRIAVSADGNKDPDDVGATPAGLAMLAHLGLQDSLVHYNVNDQIWHKPSDKIWESAQGSAKRMGFDSNVFFDAITEYKASGNDNLATRNLAAAINASSANDRLLIVGAGKMEVIYQAVKLADPKKRQFAQVLSHTKGNDDHKRDGGHNRKDVENLGVSFIRIRNQNGGFNPDKKSGNGFDAFSWMKDHSNQDLRWVYERIKVSGKADISDAGMIYYALTGNERGDINDLKDFFNDKSSPKQIPVTKTKPILSPTPVILDIEPNSISKLTPRNTAKGDIIEGKSKSSKLKGTSAPDVIKLSADNDIVESKGGDDTVDGGGGNDTLYGGKNNDLIFGGTGNDKLEGGRHSDTLYGGAGNDQLIGVHPKTNKKSKEEIDILVGGGGADTFVLGDLSKAYYVTQHVKSKEDQNYALIKDFNLGQGDRIQLSGNASDYDLSEISGGTGIYAKSSGQPNLIAIVESSLPKSLTSESFTYF